MGLPRSSFSEIVYLNTDTLTAGILSDRLSDHMHWNVLKVPRTELRQNVGRVVAQVNGPDIVVYDFTEIVTQLGTPEIYPREVELLIIGQRPAAIVCQGAIGAYNSSFPSTSDFEEPSDSADLSISALNSCDPDNPYEVRWPGSSPGGDGSVRFAEAGAGSIVYFSGTGGSGGYGGSGREGGSDIQYTVTAPGGAGGVASFNWGVLQPGSPGGDGLYVGSSSYTRGGPGGGALLIKAKGSIALAEVSARGGFPNGLRGGYGSGGHVVIDCPGAVRVGRIYIAGGSINAGGGVVEFRNTTRVLGSGSGGPQVWSGSSSPGAEPQWGVVGIPQGVAFPSSGSTITQAVYNTTNQPDSSAPLISINGNRIRVVAEGSAWADEGASATDGAEGAVAVTTSGFVNTAIPGSYEITYTAADSKGNTARKKRYVTVMPNQPTMRDPQSGLPELVAAALRPVNSLTRAVDARLLPSFEFTTVDGLKYPSLTFLRRARDFMPIGDYADSTLDKDARMKAGGFNYSFRTANALTSWSTSASLDAYTFVRRDSSRNGVTAPQGMEFVTYRHNTPLGSSPPLFYRVAIKAEPLN